MLRGFSVPLTPQGESALAKPPPWHYSSDCIAVEYWADQNAIAALLPPGLTVGENSAGRAFFWFLDWQFTASNDELTAPARYQYREAFVLIEAIFDGTPVNDCPYIFVDNDAAIARGWAQGFPKKYASVCQTRSFSAPIHRPFSIGRRRCAATLQSSRRIAGTHRRTDDAPLGIFGCSEKLDAHRFSGLCAGRWLYVADQQSAAASRSAAVFAASLNSGIYIRRTANEDRSDRSSSPAGG